MRRLPIQRAAAAAVALASLLAGAALADVLFADDLVVQGSQCIGFDCVNGEVFPADMMRLKENNTRIKFDDTSDPLLAPATDWGVTANDSASGAQNRFSFDDASAVTLPFWISGGAADHSLYVTSGGQVGIGTDAPAAGAKLHVAGAMRIDGDLYISGGARSGRVPAIAFTAGRTATVSFAQPYTRDYAIALTPVAAIGKGRLSVSLTARDENGFSFFVAGKRSDLVEVAWATRWVGEF
jgi:hypothetical protein